MRHKSKVFTRAKRRPFYVSNSIICVERARFEGYDSYQHGQSKNPYQAKALYLAWEQGFLKSAECSSRLCKKF